MTVGDLLIHATSYELTAWSAFLKVRGERMEEARKRAKHDREYE